MIYETDKEILDNIINSAKQCEFIEISSIKVDKENNIIDMYIRVPTPAKWIDVKIKIDDL